MNRARNISILLLLAVAATIVSSCARKGEQGAEQRGATSAAPSTATSGGGEQSGGGSPAMVHVASITSVEGSLQQNAKIAPNFAWKGVDGAEHSLKEYSGKVVVINFWGTWCGPCRAELPDIVKIRDEMVDHGVEVIGLNVGESGRPGVTPENHVAQFAKQNNIHYPLILASDEVIAAYGGIEGVPTTFVINGKGEIVEKMVGARPEQVFRDAIKKAM